MLRHVYGVTTETTEDAEPTLSTQGALHPAPALLA